MVVHAKTIRGVLGSRFDKNRVPGGIDDLLNLDTYTAWEGRYMMHGQCLVRVHNDHGVRRAWHVDGT